jgi:type 1 glutamine amidotransferase
VSREPRGRVLVFTRTCGYRHASIPAGVHAVTALAADDGFGVRHTEDPAVFTDAVLAEQDVVVWLSTSGEVLDDAQRGALDRWLRAGGGFAGVHAASTCEQGWPAYEDVVGARFAGHPDVQTASVRVEDRDHPSTAALPALWRHRDEWYDFSRNPRSRVRVLLSVDESTYRGGGMGQDHPIAWASTYGAGRTWYTALGHEPEAYADALFLEHLGGGLRSLWLPEHAGGRL